MPAGFAGGRPTRCHDKGKDGSIFIGNLYVRAVRDGEEEFLCLEGCVEEVIGRKIFDFVDAENRAVFTKQISFRAQGLPWAYASALSRPDGSQVLCQFNATPLWNDSGEQVGSFAMVTHIRERKRAELENAKLETQLRHSQKLEVIGTLAGGIAHDFNISEATRRGWHCFERTWKGHNFQCPYPKNRRQIGGGHTA